MELLTDVLRFQLLPSRLNDVGDERQHPDVAFFEACLGYAEFDTLRTVALVADVADVPRFGLLIVETVVESVMEFLAEGTVAPVLLLLHQEHRVVAHTVLGTLNHCRILYVRPESMLGLLVEPLELLLATFFLEEVEEEEEL